jgi:hypothetical protein
MSRKNDEPPLWLTVLKLVLVAAVLIGGVGLALWWADKKQSQGASPVVKPSDSWGIVNDSPIQFRR